MAKIKQAATKSNPLASASVADLLAELDRRGLKRANPFDLVVTVQIAMRDDRCWQVHIRTRDGRDVSAAVLTPTEREGWFSRQSAANTAEDALIRLRAAGFDPRSLL